ncbi:Protein hgh1 [Elasticomyces elasticus]|nr:Protein hgh1 [Elasticomyces elasticus]
MPTELEELVEFLHHGNTQIRQIAAENLVGYSIVQPSIFKAEQLTPVKDLKLLVKDYTPIAKNALTILVNISEDQEVLKNLATDDAFLESVLLRITHPKEPNANLLSMLLANLSKSDSLPTRIITLERTTPKSLSSTPVALDQLLDLFVKGAEGRYNKDADYDYLSYLFADTAKHAEGRKHLVTPRKDDDNIVPLTKLVVFTEHRSEVRRRGVASTIKNVAFDISSHPQLLAADGVNLLPYILLPLMGPEEYSEEDTEGMLEDLQLLPPDKERERDAEIVKTHLETLLLLTTTRGGRDHLREVKVYPIVRELHLHFGDEEVGEGCDRLVQVIMRDEEGEERQAESGAPKIEEVESDEDEKIVDIL